jgi:hypothetical protein
MPIQETTEVRSFCVRATPSQPPYETDASLPSHRLVLRPLLAAAVEARIIGRIGDPEILALLSSIAERKRGYVELDVSKELVRGYERLWNTSSWGRGSIVVVCEPARLEPADVLHYCEGPWTWSSRYQMLKGTPRAAVAFAESAAVGGRYAFLFSASNGIEWMEVFAPTHLAAASFETAAKTCRKFKRFVEHNPDAQDEIIVDRSPYAHAQ